MSLPFDSWYGLMGSRPIGVKARMAVSRNAPASTVFITIDIKNDYHRLFDTLLSQGYQFWSEGKLLEILVEAFGKGNGW